MAGRSAREFPPFQYPQADRSLCNCRNSAPFRQCWHLSVSSSGSKPLQRRMPSISTTCPDPLSVSSSGSKPLQLPDSFTSERPPAWDLSVSSSGSKPLQRSSSSMKPRSLRPFSILKRIEASATLPGTRSADFLSLRSFQYPQADRSLCNRPPRKPLRDTSSIFSNDSGPVFGI